MTARGVCVYVQVVDSADVGVDICVPELQAELVSTSVLVDCMHLGCIDGRYHSVCVQEASRAQVADNQTMIAELRTNLVCDVSRMVCVVMVPKCCVGPATAMELRTQ